MQRIFLACSRKRGLVCEPVMEKPLDFFLVFNDNGLKV